MSLFMFFGVIALIVMSFILHGWVLSILWGWFMVPMFRLPPLGTAQMIAVSIIVSMMTFQYMPPKTGTGDELGPVIFSIVFSLASLLAGWGVKQWL